jgi:hypothetical protein
MGFREREGIEKIRLFAGYYAKRHKSGGKNEEKLLQIATIFSPD